MEEKMDDGHKEMKAMLDAYLEKMEANPGEQQSAAVHQEVPKEEATVETFRALKKWYGDRHQGTGVSQKLAVTGIRNRCHSQGQDNFLLLYIVCS
jgi:hypothetical protein